MKKDKIALGAFIGPDERIGVRQRASGELDVVTFSTIREGEPLQESTEIVRIEDPDCSCGGWQESETIYKMPKAGGDGPAQVATPAYREGYDRIFGKKPAVGLA